MNEYACDDAVAPRTGKTVYAQALIRAAKYSLNPKTPFTMAATDQSTFTRRVQRLFAPASSPAPRLATNRRSLLLAIFAVFPLCLTLVYGGNPLPLDPPDGAMVTSVVSGKIVTGQVIDINTRQPLIGATVVVEGLDAGTITDFEGHYQIELPNGEQRLTFGYVGYLTTTVTVPETEINVTVAMAPGGESSRKVMIRSTEGADGSVQVDRLSDDTKRNILTLVDGERLVGKTMDDIDPKLIESIDVVKGEERLKELGYGTDFEGAVLIRLKKE